MWIPQPFSNLVIIYLLAYEDEIECSETSAYKIQTPRNYPEENIQQILQFVCSCSLFEDFTFFFFCIVFVILVLQIS
jgi:hypothetical protein